MLHILNFRLNEMVQLSGAEIISIIRLTVIFFISLFPGICFPLHSGRLLTRFREEGEWGFRGADGPPRSLVISSNMAGGREN